MPLQFLESSNFIPLFYTVLHYSEPICVDVLMLFDEKISTAFSGYVWITISDPEVDPTGELTVWSIS